MRESKMIIENIAKAQHITLSFLSGKNEVYFVGTHEAFLGTNVASLVELANAITYDTKGFECYDVGADMYCTLIRSGLYVCYTEGHGACDPNVQQSFFDFVKASYQGTDALNFVLLHTGD